MSGDPEQRRDRSSDHKSCLACGFTQNGQALQETRRPFPEITHERQVGGIVEGTVLRSSERAHISVQLIDAF